MPQGLQIFNSAGQIIFNTEDRITRFIGNQLIAGNGSINVPDFASGLPFWYTYLLNGILQPLETYPQVNISGTTITWSTPSTPYTTVGLYYGVC